MKSSIIKHSVVIGGHKTSVSLEQPFWSAVRELAESRAMTISDLLREIDQNRRNANLSSAVRVFVLENVRQNAAAAEMTRQNNRETEAFAASSVAAE
jgi:predicted DNA-binding ribbon-helix-helix protein